MANTTTARTIGKSFFESHWDEIYNICRKKAGYWNNIPRYLTREDLAHDAFIKVKIAFDSEQYDGQRPWEAFVREIAKNAFIDACRRTRCLKVVSLEDIQPVELLRLDVVALNISPFLANLSERQRKVIEKTYGIGDAMWEQNDDSIATDLGVTRQTIISDRKKAMEAMRVRVGKKKMKV